MYIHIYIYLYIYIYIYSRSPSTFSIGEPAGHAAASSLGDFDGTSDLHSTGRLKSPMAAFLTRNLDVWATRTTMTNNITLDVWDLTDDQLCFVMGEMPNNSKHPNSVTSNGLGSNSSSIITSSIECGRVCPSRRPSCDSTKIRRVNDNFSRTPDVHGDLQNPSWKEAAPVQPLSRAGEPH